MFWICFEHITEYLRHNHILKMMMKYKPRVIIVYFVRSLTEIFYSEQHVKQSSCLRFETVCHSCDEWKHQSFALLAFVRGIHRWPVDSPHKGPVTQKMLPFDDVVIFSSYQLMTQCWQQQASSRISILELRRQIEWLLGLHANYMDLENLRKTYRTFDQYICSVSVPTPVANEYIENGDQREPESVPLYAEIKIETSSEDEEEDKNKRIE